MTNIYNHARFGNGYEVSTRGDRMYSALNARLADGRTIEEAYQLDVKGYRTVSDNWRRGKGRPPLTAMTPDELYQQYKALWKQWIDEEPYRLTWLRQMAIAHNFTLTDCFATTPISQARALAELLNEAEAAR